MSYVIQINWQGGNEGTACPESGRYVKHFDPDAHEGLGQVWTTADPQDALQFPSFSEANEFWKQPSSVKPQREDGKPNRPLTAFTVSIFDWKTQAATIQ